MENMDTLKRKIVTRFAPSPTGFLHVGGLRTALYSYLLAKQNEGTFILRIEDTDRERHVEGGIENILESLLWAGIIPDEGVSFSPDKRIIEIGEHGPYIQSKKIGTYKKHAEELVEKGHAFYCFCTPERLEEVREYRQKNKMAPGYDGLCKTLPKEEVSERIKNGESHVIRLNMPDEGETKFTDLIRGEVIFKNADIDDQVLLKSDGFPTYHLAVVIDDHDMGVTHAIRGEEWISSTPKHLILYRFFGWQEPQFAHLPLLLNTDKSKLSKRQGDVAVLDYRDKGYLPEALINFVAFLGWNPGTEQEFFSLDELIQAFSLEKVNKAGAVFNLEKLDWFNREYLRKKSASESAEYLNRFMPDEIKNMPMYSMDFLIKLTPNMMERISKGNDLQEMHAAGELSYFFAQPDYDVENLFWKTLKDDPEKKQKTRTHLENLMRLLSNMPAEHFSHISVKEAVWEYADKAGRGEVLWPARYALWGRDKSPDPFMLAEILGKNEALSRLKIALKKLE